MGCKIGNNKFIQINTIPKYTTDLRGKFLFMRHGKTSFNSDHNKTRQINPLYIDCHLSEEGIKQVKYKQTIINSLTIEKVYVSPFYRALQTASLLLENHPNLNNIKVLVHPKIAEIGGCTHDFIYDIQQNKKDFNMNSTVKFDWKYFDEYISKIIYDENFFYFEEFNNLSNDIKTQIYNNLKELYKQKDINLYKKALENLAMHRIKIRKRFESINHEYERFLELKRNLNLIHKLTLNDKDKKVLIISHSSFIKIATSPGIYEGGKNKPHPSCHPVKNLEIISIF